MRRMPDGSLTVSSPCSLRGVEVRLSTGEPGPCRLEVMAQDGTLLAEIRGTVGRDGEVRETVDLPGLECWSPSNPAAYRLRATSGDFRGETWFGFGKAEWQRTGIHLNEERVEIRALRFPPGIVPGNRDLEFLLRFGFNTVIVTACSYAVREFCIRRGILLIDEDPPGPLGFPPMVAMPPGTVGWIRIAYDERYFKDPVDLAHEIEDARGDFDHWGYSLRLPPVPDPMHVLVEREKKPTPLGQLLQRMNQPMLVFLRLPRSGFEPGEETVLAIGLANRAGYRGMGYLRITGTMGKRELLFLEHSVHIGPESRAFSPETIRLPESPGTFVLQAALSDARRNPLAESNPVAVSVAYP